MQLAQKTGNIPQIIKIFNHIGVAYFFDTKYDKSIQNFHKSLELSKQLNDSVGIARSYNNIGLIYEKQNNYDEAIRYNLMSLAIKETFKSKEGLIHPLTNLSNISILKNDYKNGEKYMFRMLELSQELNDTTLIAVAYSNLAKIYANNDELGKSDIYLKKTLGLINHIEDKFEYSQLLYDLAGTYQKKKAFKKSEKAFLECISISEKLRKKELLEKSYKELSDLYRNNKKYTKALNYYDKYTAVKDSFFTVDKLKAVSEIATKYETAKKEQEIGVLKNNIKQQKKFWYWVSSLLILLMLFAVFFFYFYKKRSQELAEKNSQVNKALAEKEVLFKEVHHRVKNNLQVVSSILALQGRYLKSPTAIAAIKDSQNRIDAISLMHQKLYSKDSIKAIYIKDYIDDLVYSIIDSLESNPERVQYHSQVANIILEVDTVTPIGLIINELIVNTLKHNNQQKTINLFVTLQKLNEQLVLKVKDNGQGLPKSFDFNNTDSYGMKMIASLSKKLKATIDFTNDKGLEVVLIIKKFKEIEA